MTDSIHIRRATPADSEAILDLVRVSLGEGTIPRTLAYWKWKHEANPFGASPVLVAEADGQLVALRAFMRWTWQSGERAIPAVRAVDTATHPDYRGQGLFKRLTLQLRDEMAEEGVVFVFNTPNTQSRPGYLKMGWSLVGKPTLWVRPVQPIRLALELRREGLGGEEDAPPSVEAAPASDVLCEPDVQELVEATSAERVERFHTPKRRDYLQWRYADIPGFAYQALSRGAGADGALVILRTRQRGALREIRLCDMVIGPTRMARRNGQALLREVPRLADVDVVLAMAAGRPALRWVLLTSGYIPAPHTGPILTVYPFPAVTDLPDPRRLASWAASIGDLELF